MAQIGFTMFIHLPWDIAVYTINHEMFNLKQKTWKTCCGKRVATNNLTSLISAVDCIDCIHEYARFIRETEIALGKILEY